MTIEKQFDAGVIVARLHVPKLHDGHLKVINAALTQCYQVIIFLGITPVQDSSRNPLDFATRELMVRHELLGYNVVVLPLPDNHSDVEWSKNLDRRIKEVVPMGSVMLYGGRDSFLSHYSGVNKFTQVDALKSECGTIVREAASKTPLNSKEFRAGVIYGKANQFPKVHPTVDIALWKQIGSGFVYILMGRKPAEKNFRFFGGFVDPDKDASYEEAALREFHEETNKSVMIKNPMKYVGSVQVDDWRYRRDRNKIITTLYSVEYLEGEPKPGDDICEVKWVDLRDFPNLAIEPVHVPLRALLLKKEPWQKYK